MLEYPKTSATRAAYCINIKNMLESLVKDLYKDVCILKLVIEYLLITYKFSMGNSAANTLIIQKQHQPILEASRQFGLHGLILELKLVNT
jgi:hypothetical protein